MYEGAIFGFQSLIQCLPKVCCWTTPDYSTFLPIATEDSEILWAPVAKLEIHQKLAADTMGARHNLAHAIK